MTRLSHHHPHATPTSPRPQSAGSARASGHQPQSLTLDQPLNSSAVRDELACANALRQASDGDSGAARKPLLLQSP